LSVNFLAQHTW